MIWKLLLIVTVIFIASWLAGIFFLLRRNSNINQNLAKFLPLIGNTAILIFIVSLWIELDRPPLRTMAETRLWYSFFVCWVTWMIFIRTKSIPMYILGFIMSAVFLIVDLIHPEYQSKSLMPALQSPWFIPHVVIYMISYAVLFAASTSAIVGLFASKRSKFEIEKYINLSMDLVYPGMGLLTLGMLMGAIWAKIAWGNYWTWDPKETWAALTWLFYMLTIHLHFSYPQKKKLLLWIIGLSFIVLIITWLGIRYLPSGLQSIHVYGS